HDVFFAHDEQLVTVDLDGGARILAEEDLVADLHVDSGDLAVFVLLARAHGQDFALVGFFGGGVGDDDAGGGLALFLEALDDDAIVQRTQFHGFSPQLGSRLANWGALDAAPGNPAGGGLDALALTRDA